MSETAPTPAPRIGRAFVYWFETSADFVRVVDLDGVTVSPPVGTAINGGTVCATVEVDIDRLPLVAVFSRDEAGTEDIGVQRINPFNPTMQPPAIVFNGPTVVNVG